MAELRTLVDETCKKYNYKGGEEGTNYLVYWEDKTYGVVKREDVDLRSKDDFGFENGKATYNKRSYEVIVLLKGSDEESETLFSIAGDLSKNKGKTDVPSSCTGKRQPKKKSFLEFDIETDEVEKIKVPKTTECKKGKKTDVPKTTQKAQKTEVGTKRKTDSKQKTAVSKQKEDILAEKKQKESSRRERLVTTQSFILDQLMTSAEPSEPTKDLSQTCPQTQLTPLSPVQDAVQTQLNSENDCNQLASNWQSPSTPQVHYPVPQYNMMPYPYYNDGHSAYYNDGHSVTPTTNLVYHSENSCFSPTSRTNFTSPINKVLFPSSCGDCVLKDSQIESLQTTNRQYMNDILSLRQQVKNLEAEKENNPCYSGTNHDTEETIKDHYIPNRGVQIDLAAYKFIPLGEELPQGYERLNEDSRLAVPRTWLASVLAKCKGHTHSFAVKKLMDGFFEPSELQGQTAVKFSSKNEVMKGIKLNGAIANRRKWCQFLYDIDVLLWVVDSANPGRFEESKQALHEFIGELDKQEEGSTSEDKEEHSQYGIPIVIVATKQDKQKSATPCEIYDRMEPGKLTSKHKVYLIGTEIPNNGHRRGLWRVYELISFATKKRYQRTTTSTAV